jgi:hypothetical protein
VEADVVGREHVVEPALPRAIEQRATALERAREHRRVRMDANPDHS